MLQKILSGKAIRNSMESSLKTSQGIFPRIASFELMSYIMTVESSLRASQDIFLEWLALKLMSD